MAWMWYVFVIAALLGRAWCDDEYDLPPPPSGNQRVKICSDHPNIDEILQKGAASYTLPSTHPTIHPLLSPYIGGKMSPYRIVY